ARAAEAALKTYLIGALFGIFMLLGVTLLYGVGGTTSYPELDAALTAAPTAVVAAGFVAVLGGLAFKAGSVPAHFWVPDAAQGSTALTAAFVTTVPKVGAVIAAYRLVVALPDTLTWGVLVGVVAVASMTLGNLAAFAQEDPRRLLGWSTVSQVGYLLVPVAVAGLSDLALPSMLLYLTGYAVTNLAAFAVTAALPAVRDLSGYAGLVRVQPALAVALSVSLLGLVGTPPTIVFVGKLTAATAAWDGGMAWLTAALLANSLVSLFYYLRWIAPTLRRDTPRPALRSPTPWSTRAAVITAAVSVLLGVFAGPLWGVMDGSLLR
ncbi:MAG: proton-conducting transporter membrane subunit, partial [Knoellia sp.]